MHTDDADWRNITVWSAVQLATNFVHEVHAARPVWRRAARIRSKKVFAMIEDLKRLWSEA